jgi:hypothetical protein
MHSFNPFQCARKDNRGREKFQSLTSTRQAPPAPWAPPGAPQGAAASGASLARDRCP